LAIRYLHGRGVSGNVAWEAEISEGEGVRRGEGKYVVAGYKVLPIGKLTTSPEMDLR